MELPLRRLEEIPEKEEPLKIKDYILIKLCAFDLGSTIPGIKIDPAELCEYLVHRGIAVANEDPYLGIHGPELYVARELGLLEEKIAEKLRKPKLSEEEHNRLLERIKGALKEADSERLKETGERFRRLTALLWRYSEWDSEQIPTYVERRRFGRLIFKPLLVRFKHWEGFRVVEVAASIHRSGVGCLTLWFRPANPKGELRVEDLLGIIQHPEGVEVEAAIPVEMEKWIEGAREFEEFSMDRLEDLDDEANRHDIAEELEIEYKCFKGNLSSLASIYLYAIYSCCGEQTKESIQELHRTGMYWYGLLYVFVEGVREPWEVISKHPRQIHGILVRDKHYEMCPDHVIRYEVVDVSPHKEWTFIFSPVVMLRVLEKKAWRRVIETLEKGVWHLELISNVTLFEMLSSLLLLLMGYDLLLSELVEAEADVERLVEGERSIVVGLEEIYAVRHSIFVFVRDWWPLAEERIGITELHEAVMEKLDMVREIITTARQERLNRLMKRLTIIGVVATIVGAIAAWPQIWQLIKFIQGLLFPSS